MVFELEGFSVSTYENGDELANEMLSRMTCDRRWLTPDRMAERADLDAIVEDCNGCHGADGVSQIETLLEVTVSEDDATIIVVMAS